MKLAVLPLNATNGAPPPLGRQFSNFSCDILRVSLGTEDIRMVSFIGQVQDPQGGPPRATYVNIADALLEQDLLNQMFTQSDQSGMPVDGLMDGMLKATGPDAYELTYRFHRRGTEGPDAVYVEDCSPDTLFPVLTKMVQRLAQYAEIDLPAELQAETLDFGTESAIAFLRFLEGYDAVLYIQQANGMVAREFDPQYSIDRLLESCELDPDYLGPYETCVSLCRLCAQYQIGSFDMCEKALLKLTELAAEDFRAFFALGELHQSSNNPQAATDWYEKAVRLEPNEAALYTRLGLAQMMMNMPVNAERNFRKAVELEGDEKPSLDFLAGVLQQTGRRHEIIGLWKEQVQRNPLDAPARAKLAMALIEDGRAEEGERVFEEALEFLEETVYIKRFYAPYLASKGDLDRAMDYYEDVLDEAPTEIPVLLEYAQTLRNAGREFEVPKVLRDVLAANPDQDTRAQTLQWLIELEQQRRTEVVNQAREKAQTGDFNGAITMLRPLTNWLSDYWPMWALLSSCLNMTGSYDEAMEASQKLLELYPGCEPAYGELYTSLRGQGRTQEAYNMLRMAAQRMPNSLGIHVNLAIAAMAAGHEDEARNLARMLREAVGGNQQALAEVDQALATAGL